MKRMLMRDESFHHFGFTLSEVLITLGIIGVIAALLIPPILNYYQNQECVTRLKRFYTNLNQAVQDISADYGCPGDLKCTGIFDVDKGSYQKNSIYILTLLANYLQTDKICSSDSSAPFASDAPGCFGYDILNRPYSFLNGNTALSTIFYEINAGDRVWATLNDGTFYGLLNVKVSPSNYSRVYVDVNGAKKPNQLGRDVFYFQITDKAQVIPYDCTTGGSDGSCTKNICDPTGYGQSCSAKLLQDSWHMNY